MGCVSVSDNINEVQIVTNEQCSYWFYRNPTPSVSELIPLIWNPATDKEQTTMIIGDVLKLEKDILKTRMSMWEKLYKKYGNPFNP